MPIATGPDPPSSLGATPSSPTKPFFWSNPLRYCRWAAHNKPAYFFSLLIGGTGPLLLLVAPPLKRWYGWEPRPRIPLTYPIPTGPRQTLEGYEDS